MFRRASQLLTRRSLAGSSLLATAQPSRLTWSTLTTSRFQSTNNNKTNTTPKKKSSKKKEKPSIRSVIEETSKKETPETAPQDNNTSNNSTNNKKEGAPKKTPMVKGFKIEEVASLCTSGDALFARRLPSGGCQFFAWPGTPLAIASNAITSMPDTIRTVHAVFGRKNTPIDIVVDVDCPVPQEHWSMHKIRPYQLQVMETVCSVLKEEVEKIGEQIETQVVLNSPNLKKASFHIHTKLKDVAFRDYDSLHGFLAGFHQRIPTVDLQIYRPNGMLRMFSSMKENHTSAMVVFEDARWNIGFPNGVVPPEAAALHSVCIREPGTYSRLLTFTPPAAKPFEPRTRDNNNNNADLSKDAYEEGDVQETVKIIPVPLPYSKQEAIDNASRWLRAATEFEVMEWRQWVSLGITAFRVAYHFRDANLKRPAMDEMLDAWVEASRQCPTKFKPGDCERHWATFDVEKLAKGGEADWWLAYQRLGRLQVSGKENIALDEERRAKRHRRP